LVGWLTDWGGRRVRIPWERFTGRLRVRKSGLSPKHEWPCNRGKRLVEF